MGLATLYYTHRKAGPRRGVGGKDGVQKEDDIFTAAIFWQSVLDLRAECDFLSRQYGRGSGVWGGVSAGLVV